MNEHVTLSLEEKIWWDEQRKPKQLLLVDDSEEDCRLIQSATKEFNCQWSFASDAHIAVRMISNAGASFFHVVFLDLRLGKGMDGADAYSELKSRWPKLKVIVFAGMLDFESQTKIISLGFAPLFGQKPTQFTQEYFDEMFGAMNIPKINKVQVPERPSA